MTLKSKLETWYSSLGWKTELKNTAARNSKGKSWSCCMHYTWSKQQHMLSAVTSRLMFHEPHLCKVMCICVTLEMNEMRSCYSCLNLGCIQIYARMKDLVTHALQTQHVMSLTSCYVTHKNTLRYRDAKYSLSIWCT